MQREASYDNHGAYLDTNVDEAEYDYIEDLPPKDSHAYEELRHMPHTVGRATPVLKSGTGRPEPPAEHAPATATVTQNEGCSRRPPWWAWVVLVTVLIMAGTLFALLGLFLRPATSPASLAATTNMTTAAKPSTLRTTPSPNPQTSTTGPTTTAPITIYRDCLAAYNDGQTRSGVYQISPDGVTKKDVWCEQELDGGGWTVFQRRMDGTVNFTRNWQAYKIGFGSTNSEYWLGNDIIHLMTVNEDQKMKVELEHGGLTAYADYSEFWIGDEGGRYRLHINGFSNGQINPGDSLYYHNGRDFSTYDRDHDTNSGNCAARLDSAWWYANCGQAYLNALYGSIYYRWFHWSGHAYPLTASRMMLKTK